MKEMLVNYFTTTDLGICQYFLGLGIYYLRNGFLIPHRPFMKKIVSISKLENKKPATIPLPLTKCLYESSKYISGPEKEQMNNIP